LSVLVYFVSQTGFWYLLIMGAKILTFGNFLMMNTGIVEC